MLTVEVRNASLVPVGTVDTFESLTFAEVWMGVGGWVLELEPQSSAVDELLRPGAGIIVKDGGRIVYSGPVGIGPNSQPTARRDRSTVGEPVDTLTIFGDDDMVHLADRRAHPSPYDGNFASQAYHVVTGPASTVMLTYIAANLGDDALPARHLSGIVLAGDPATGEIVTGRGRTQTVLELCNEVAVGAGVRIVQDRRNLRVKASAVVDRSADVIFSVEFGNLAGVVYEQAPSEATVVYVAGQGEGAARQFVEASVPGVRRIEAFVDRRDIDNVDELHAAARVALTELAGTATLTLNPLDSDFMRYGVDYHLGDLVKVIVDGVSIVDQVRAVETTVDADGVDRQFTIGALAPVGIQALFAQLRRMSARVGQLERI